MQVQILYFQFFKHIRNLFAFEYLPIWSLKHVDASFYESIWYYYITYSNTQIFKYL